jgi:hypothetical protein
MEFALFRFPDLGSRQASCGLVSPPQDRSANKIWCSPANGS